MERHRPLPTRPPTAYSEWAVGWGAGCRTDPVALDQTLTPPPCDEARSRAPRPRVDGHGFCRRPCRDLFRPAPAPLAGRYTLAAARRLWWRCKQRARAGAQRGSGRTDFDAGCQPSPAPAKTGGRSEPVSILSCSADRGDAAARKLVKICTSVSPATHPPCNAVNSCAMIEDEIARSCALMGNDAAGTPGCEVDPKSDAAAADVVRRYYAAINAHDYSTAWIQWGQDGRPGQRFADFQKGFAHTRATSVTIGRMAPARGGGLGLCDRAGDGRRAARQWAAAALRRAICGATGQRRAGGECGPAALAYRSATLKPAAG